MRVPLPDCSGSGDLSSNMEMEVDAFKHLFPLPYFEYHLSESIRPDTRSLERARDTTLALGAVASAHGSALAKNAIDLHMPLISSPIIRSGRPIEIVPVISKQLIDTISRQDIYYLDADGALFDPALLSAIATFSHLQIPIVSLNDDGKIVLVLEEDDGAKLEKEPVNKEKRKLTLNNIPFSLTCILHKNYILVDPTTEEESIMEESIMETLVTVVLDSSSRIMSFNKDCVTLTKKRVKELEEIISDEAISGMDID